MRFNQRYFILSVILFIIELYIGFYVKDKFVRPFIGDFLAVVLIYFMLRTICKTPATRMAIYVLLFAYTVEILQFINIIDYLQLRDNKLARILIGTTFSWGDMLAYTLGIGLVILLEKKYNSN